MTEGNKLLNLGASGAGASKQFASLELLAELWRRERLTSRAMFDAERQHRPLAERVRRGLALARLSIVDTDASPGGRTLLWLAPEGGRGPLPLNETRLQQGAPVQLWCGEGAQRLTEHGIIARVLRDRLSVAVSADYADFLDQQAFALDLIAPEVTFDRGDQGLRGFHRPGPERPQQRLAGIFFGDEITTLLRDVYAVNSA